MSTHWTAIVWERSPYTHSMKLVHLALADYANRDGVCWPGRETLAAKAIVTTRYLRDALQTMVNDGHLRIAGGKFHLLDPELSSSQPELSSSQIGTQFLAEGNSVPPDGNSVPVLYRTVTEPSLEPSVEPTTPTPSGHGGGTMPNYGSLDDDDEMPENGAPPKSRSKRFEEAPKKGTGAWLVYRFGQEQRQHGCGRGFNVKLLNSVFRDLRNEGYSNPEIEVFIRIFFARQEQNIRAKRGEYDVAQMFRAQIHPLKEQAKSQVTDLRRGLQGGRTNAQRNREAQDALMAAARRAASRGSGA